MRKIITINKLGILTCWIIFFYNSPNVYTFMKQFIATSIVTYTISMLFASTVGTLFVVSIIYISEA